MTLIVIWWGWTPSTLTPRAQEAQKGDQWGSGASAVHFVENFIKQKLLGTILYLRQIILNYIKYFV